MARKLEVTYSIESGSDFCKSMLADLGVPYTYIFSVRWYQFWRWHLVFNDDYILSRAALVILMRKMAGIIKADIEAELEEKDDG